jgi:anti-sigma-K factor RskA
MTRPESEPTRLDELLADAVLFGLSPEEQAELDRLLAENPDADLAALERLTADVARSLVPNDPPALPGDIAKRVLHAAGNLLPTGALDVPPTPLPEPTTTTGPQPRSTRLLRVAAISGWAATAACLLAAVGLWQLTRVGREPTVAEARERLLASADTIRIDWTATKDPAANGATGDVVWSPSAQQGFMRFRGLEANNPDRTQYQLWIFDAKRDERYPVDGGVFDVPPTGDVVVPIRPAVRVDSPVLFAITIERPGGVVVSSRERLPLLAKVSP